MLALVGVGSVVKFNCLPKNPFCTSNFLILFVVDGPQHKVQIRFLHKHV